jgi:hypothetical protein
MKRVTNIKDSIMMPPPKARPKSRSDTSEELRRNLVETGVNIHENNLLQDEFQKFAREMEELDSKSKRMDDEWSISKSTSSYNYFERGLNNNLHSIQSPSSFSQNTNLYDTNKNPNSFNFNLVNYNYNYISNDEEENFESKLFIEKLKKNLASTTSNTGWNQSREYKKYQKMQSPKDSVEIRIFADNLIEYLNDHEFDPQLSHLKIKLQTRFNDFKNKGLKEDYFKDSLIKMQRELLSRICMVGRGEDKIEECKMLS